MRSRIGPVVSILLVLTTLALLSACKANDPDGTPDYPVTIIVPTASPIVTELPPPSWTPDTRNSPTIDWGQVTLMPLRTPDSDEMEESTESTEPIPTLQPLTIPDPLTELDLDLLAPATYASTLADAEISLGRIVLPVDLIGLAEVGSFSVRSIPI